MSLRIQTVNNPTQAGPDYRVNATDRASEDFHSSFYSVKDGEPRDSRTEVEVQAFRTHLRGGGYGQEVNIALFITSRMGSGDILLSKDEATNIAHALLYAVRDAGQLEVAAYIEAHRDPTSEALGCSNDNYVDGTGLYGHHAEV